MRALLYIISNDKSNTYIYIVIFKCFNYCYMDFEWQRILFNNQPQGFLIEVVVRTLWMFLVLVVCLRLSGKRGVKQLSVFEMVMIIAMGSAAGDPMLYDNVGIVPAMIVLVVILAAYHLIVAVIARNEKVELFFEGKPITLIEEGRMASSALQKDNFGIEEFFSLLRSNSVEHLGQVRYALLETSGALSIFYYKDDDVKPGLPIIPAVYWKIVEKVEHPGLFACTFCGYVEEKGLGLPGKCKQCARAHWVSAIHTKRIS